MLLSAVLNALAVVAALALAVRARLGGRAERALAVIMTWNFLVMCPVYALGLTNHLTARALAWTSAPFFAVVFVAARGRTPWAAFAARLARAGLEIVRLPFDAIVLCARARSLAALAAAFTLAMIAWGLWCSYLSPSWKQWDALWYHEPMVGFAIQNHGFAFVDLPAGGAQKINGYPRLCEMTQLWFVIFTDRRVIDMVGYVAAPALALSVFVLAVRYGCERVVAVALGCALVLMPASVRMLGSVYVDAHNAAFVLGGAHFATRPKLRPGDALLAAVCLALAVGSKPMALVPSAVLGVVAAARLLGEARRRPAAVAGAIALGFSLIAASAAAVYLRNWVHFGNPFWPDLKYENPKWHIHWPGYVEWGTNQFDRGTGRIDMNLPLSDLLEALYKIPYSYQLPQYDQMWEYGIGMTWVVFPLAVAATAALCFVLARDVAGRLLGIPGWRAAPDTFNLVPLAATLAAIVRASPALWGARYQIAAAGLALVMIGWVAGRRGFQGFGEGVAGALTAMSFVSFYWETPRTWLKWSEAKALARIPYPRREVTPAPAIAPGLEIWNGSPVTLDVGLAREKQLGPGAVLAFPDAYGVYMALFWNNTFSNRAVYVPSGPGYLDRLAQAGATWAYCATGDPTCADLSRPDSGWELVGRLDVENHGSVYRRTRW